MHFLSFLYFFFLKVIFFLLCLFSYVSINPLVRRRPFYCTPWMGPFAVYGECMLCACVILSVLL